MPRRYVTTRLKVTRRKCRLCAHVLLATAMILSIDEFRFGLMNAHFHFEGILFR